MLLVVSVATRPPAMVAQRPGSAVIPARAESRSDIDAMLRSSDPVQQAWGAWWSAHYVLPEMSELLQQIVSKRIVSVSADDAAAADLALDALIQLNAVVAPELAMLVYDRRPTQALVLLSKSGNDATPALLGLLQSQQGLPWFAAANLTLARRAPGLALTLLDGLEISATLTVSRNGGVSSHLARGFGARCGGIALAKGLPPWPSYELTEIATPGVVVLALGPTPIYYRRTVSPAGQTPAAHSVTIGEPSAVDRLKYVAMLAGFDTSDLPLHGVESFSMLPSDAAAVEREIVRIRENLLVRHAVLVRRLVDLGVMTTEEAAAVSPPRISVTVDKSDGE